MLTQTVLQSQAEAPRSFWDFKVARDNLLNELDMLSRLLDCLHSKSKKGLAAFYGIIVILCVFSPSKPERLKLLKPV